jgi:hypothetical protein
VDLEFVRAITAHKGDALEESELRALLNGGKTRAWNCRESKFYNATVSAISANGVVTARYEGFEENEKVPLAYFRPLIDLTVSPEKEHALVEFEAKNEPESRGTEDSVHSVTALEEKAESMDRDSFGVKAFVEQMQAGTVPPYPYELTKKVVLLSCALGPLT